MNLFKLRNFNPVSLLASLMMLCSGVSAEVLRVKNIDEFGSLGYVSMDRLNATLLYTAMTGEPYNPKLVVYKSWADFPRAYDGKRTELISGDEFASKDALKVFQPIMDSRIDKIRQAKGYVVPLTVEVGEYDFKAQRFPIRIVMSHDDSDSNKTYTCGWEFKFAEGKTNRGQAKKLGACLTAKNWAKDNSAFKYLPLSEADARKTKKAYTDGALAFYFLMERTGNFQIVKDPNFHYTHQPNGRELRDGIGGVVNVAGLQGANVLQFIIADKASGEIYAVMPMPDAPVSNTRARNERVSVATETAPGATTSAAGPSTTIDSSSPRYVPGPPLKVASSAGTESNSSTSPRAVDRTPVAPQNAPPMPPRKALEFPPQEKKPIRITLDK
jgi:hypothetical protein